ncbi:MAG: hypothetical protein JSS34_01140 [Proteobacteria bacterium]|nr:hypothetical protein [Pseudomonadota bacterium]
MVKITKKALSHPQQSKSKEKKHVKNKNEKEERSEKIKAAQASSHEHSLASKEPIKKEKIISDVSLKDEKNEEKSKGSKQKSFVIFLWVLGMAVLVLMGALFWEAMEEGKNVSSVSSEVSDLAETQETLEMRIKKLEENQIILRTQLEKFDLLEKDFVQTQGEMAALNGRLNALESRHSQVILPQETALLARQSSADQAHLRQLEERVSEIEKILLLKNKAGQESLKVMQSFSNLQQVVLAGRPFEEELKALMNEIAVSDETLQDLLKSLKPLSYEGIATPVDLYLSFPNVADKISIILRPEPQNFKEKILSRIKNLVSVRRIKGGSVTKETLDRTLVNIEQVLGYGDLKRALEMLKSIGLREEGEIREWIISAEQYMETQKTLQEIEGYILGSAFGEIKGINIKDNKGK